MLKVTDESLEGVRSRLADGVPVAVGYRLIIRPLPAIDGMEQVEAGKFPTLQANATAAGTSVATKSGNQQSKESHGSDIGVVVHVGPDAYNVGQLKDCKPWVKEGDVVIFKRYCGFCTELPPGSGNQYHFMSDDDIEGKYEGIEL
jgi:co-chaperonin GroES (HSP10)